MQTDLGKLFIGGISWDTDEERLREYFKSYGDVVEAIIMKDRNTGRARGFGFVVFADPAVAERVVMEKHTIDGRVVEAKKAVPRDDHSILNKSNGSIHGSPVPARTKKIFVGGLPSSVTEASFRKYFDQFGTITDVVVMYDHQTQRPRGFGFITYDSEDAVDRVLFKTFHELNGKMVEVKRAVPKEQSPAPSIRSPIGGYAYGLSRAYNFLNGYTGLNPNSTASFGMRIDGRLGSFPMSRSSFSPFISGGYGVGLNGDRGYNGIYGENLGFNSNFGYGRGPNSYYNGNASRLGSPMDFGDRNGEPRALLRPNAPNVWGDDSLNYSTNSVSSNNFLDDSIIGNLGSINGSGTNWAATASFPTHESRLSSGFGNVNLSYSLGEDNSDPVDRSNRSMNNGASRYNGAFADFYEGDSLYLDSTWKSQALDSGGSNLFEYDLHDVTSTIGDGSSSGYGGTYIGRQPNRGIAA